MSKRFIWKKACGDDESLLEDTHTNAILTLEDCLEVLNKQDARTKELEDYINEYCEYGCETCVLNDYPCKDGVLRYD